MQILIWCTSDDVTCKLNLLKKSVQTTVMITLYTPTLDKLVEETVQIFSLFDLTRQILLVVPEITHHSFMSMCRPCN